MKIKEISWTIFASLALLGCGEQEPQLTGIVLDIWGNPIRGAQVQIENTRLAAISSDSGAYAVPYVPGSFSLLISADGYNSRRVELNVAEAMEYPLDDTRLYKRPDSAGLFLVGARAYIPLIESDLEWSDDSQNRRTWTLRYPDYENDTEVASELKELDREIEEITSRNSKVLEVIDSTLEDYDFVSVEDVASLTLGSTINSITEGQRGLDIVDGKVVEVDSSLRIWQFDLASLIPNGQLAPACFLTSARTRMGLRMINESQPAKCIFTLEVLEEARLSFVRGRASSLLVASGCYKNTIGEYALINRELPPSNYDLRVCGTSFGAGLDVVEEARWDGKSLFLKGSSEYLGITGIELVLVMPASYTRAGGIMWGCSAVGDTEFAPSSCK